MGPDLEGTTMAQHTPGPLELDPTEPLAIRSPDWGGIAHVYNEPRENGALMEMARANAARLVKCWNAHDELVAKLEAVEMVVQIAAKNHYAVDWTRVRAEVQAALAKARGE